MNDEQPPSSTEWQRRLRRAIARTTRPGSGIAMCHEQDKPAVYLSEDKTCIVEHPPQGPVTRSPLAPAR